MAKMIDGAKLVENLRLIATCWSISPFVSKEKHDGAVDMLREVEREVKEAPTLTPPDEPCAGLYGKYIVYKNKDGSLVTDCFKKTRRRLRRSGRMQLPLTMRSWQQILDIINWVGVKPNEPLTCEGCDMQGEKVTPCASCIRDPRVCDYYTHRPPEEEI